MSGRSTFVGAAVFATLVLALLARAVTVHSVAWAPLIYRTIANENDLDVVEGMAPPGSFVELWYRQRNFREGTSADQNDLFSWCKWKNNGQSVRVGTTWADAKGVFQMAGLRQGTTVTLFPSAPDGAHCQGGLYTELQVRACDYPGGPCSAFSLPSLEYLNINRPSDGMARVTGAVKSADQTSVAIADGPDTFMDWGDQRDVDQMAIDTTQPGFIRGQRVSWRCGAGGTASCPSIAVHDASTVIMPDTEFPYVLGTMQAHRFGGSFIAAVATPRRVPLGASFTVNVNVKFRGRLDINMGCDQKVGFDFSRQLIL